MELEELKFTWQTVKPQIKNMGGVQKDAAYLSGKIDIKSRLLGKILCEEMGLVICVVLLATSRLWSPTKFPTVWLGLFSAIIIVAILCGVKLYRAIRHINLWEDSNAEIFTATVKVKKLYRRFELGICILIAPLFIWLSLTPPFLNTLDMYIVWGLTIVGFAIEYLWYRSNMRQLDALGHWEES